MTTPDHILVVDDDGDVRQVVAELLLRGRMRAFLDSRDPVAVIVLDSQIPGDPSVSLALQVKEQGIRVMISGSPDRMKEAQERADRLLEKFFTREELARAAKHAVTS